MVTYCTSSSLYFETASASVYSMQGMIITPRLILMESMNANFNKCFALCSEGFHLSSFLMNIDWLCATTILFCFSCQFIIFKYHNIDEKIHTIFSWNLNLCQKWSFLLTTQCKYIKHAFERKEHDYPKLYNDCMLFYIYVDRNIINWSYSKTFIWTILKFPSALDLVWCR